MIGQLRRAARELVEAPAERLDPDDITPPIAYALQRVAHPDACRVIMARACRVGTLGAWEWLQAWNAGELEPDDNPPEEW